MISEFENNIVDIAYTSVPASSRIPFKAANSIGGTITASNQRIGLKGETIAAMPRWHHVIFHQHRFLQQPKAVSKMAEPEKRGVNTSGLAVLPDELLLEIVSHLPSLPAPSEGPNNAMAYVQQRDVFLALSMSCQHLRRFFRPYVWRRLEVSSGMRIGETILRHHFLSGRKGAVAYATEIIRQLEIVTIRDPSLAEFVQYVLTRNEFLGKQFISNSHAG